MEGSRALASDTPLALCAGLLAAPAAAQTYPDRTIKLVVPQPPGGGFDTVARILADRLGPLLGQAIVVENRTGAGTLVGTEAAARAPADGYTLLLGALSNIALNPGLYPKLPYDPLKDFTPIGLAVTWSYTLVARKDLPQKDLKELIAYARDNPEKVTYASAGQGLGPAHRHGRDGAARGHQAHARGLSRRAGGLPGHPGRARRPLLRHFLHRAAASRQRRRCARSPSPPRRASPCIPMCRAWRRPALRRSTWRAGLASLRPAATPPDVLARLRAEFAKVVAMPEVAELFAKTGGRTMKLSLAETEALLRADVERWTKLIREAGISAGP